MVSSKMITVEQNPPHQLIINGQKTFLSPGKSLRSSSSLQKYNDSVKFDDHNLLHQNPKMSPSSSSPSPLPRKSMENLMTKTPPSRSPKTTGYNHSPPAAAASPSPLPLKSFENLMTKTPPSRSPQTTGYYNHSPATEEDVIVMDGFLVTSSPISPSLDGSGRGGKRSISKSSSESPVQPWEKRKEHSPFGSQPNPTSLSLSVSSSSSSPHLRKEKESLKPTIVTSSTPPSSLDVSNRSGGKSPVSKSSSESLVQMFESRNKDSLYDSRYHTSMTSLSSPVSSSSPHNLKPTTSPTSGGYSPTNSNRRRSGDQVVCKYIGTNSCRYGSKCNFFHPNGGFNWASSSLAAAPMMIPSDQQAYSATAVPKEAPLSAIQTFSGVTDWTPLDDNIISTADILAYEPQQRVRGRRLPVFKEICPAE